MTNIINKIKFSYKKRHKKTLAFKLLKSLNKEIKKNKIKDILSLFNYSNVNIFFNNFIVFQNNISPSNINFKLTLIINQIKKILPFIFSSKFIAPLKILQPFKNTFYNVHKIKFQENLSTLQTSVIKNNYLNYLNYYFLGKVLDHSLFNSL
jgi:hypothetical protein